MKTDQVYVEHIMDAIHQIEEYTRGVDRHTFEESRMLQDATVRQIEIIGEASRQLSESFRTQVSEYRVALLSECGTASRMTTSTLIWTLSGKLSRMTFPC